MHQLELVSITTIYKKKLSISWDSFPVIWHCAHLVPEQFKPVVFATL